MGTDNMQEGGAFGEALVAGGLTRRYGGPGACDLGMYTPNLGPSPYSRSWRRHGPPDNSDVTGNRHASSEAVPGPARDLPVPTRFRIVVLRFSFRSPQARITAFRSSGIWCSSGTPLACTDRP